MGKIMTLCLQLPASSVAPLPVDRYCLYYPTIWSELLGWYWEEWTAVVGQGVVLVIVQNIVEGCSTECRSGRSQGVVNVVVIVQVVELLQRLLSVSGDLIQVSD